MLEGQHKNFSINGATLHFVEWGTGPALVLLHGFTGSAAAWGDTIQYFSRTHRVVAIDALGHGLSSTPLDIGRYSFQNAAADYLGLLEALEVENAAVLGYSMGGRTALYIALTYINRVSRLILESSSPGLASSLERDNRRKNDQALAERIEKEGIASFVAYWESIPLWESQIKLSPETKAKLKLERLDNNPSGLANSLRGAGAGVQPSLWDYLPSLSVPTLLLTGELDLKFTGIGEMMNSAIKCSQLRTVSGAGHNIHLEKPEEFKRIVADFLG